MIFGFDKSGETFKSLNGIVSLSGKIPSNVYFSIFASLIILTLILYFPSKKNVEGSSLDLKKNFTVQQEVVWICAMIIMMYAIPTFILFFTNG